MDNEKSPELRHAEHELILQNAKMASDEMKRQSDALNEFMIRQSDANADWREKFLGEIHAVERSIASKCENDSAIIAIQNREVGRLDRIERDQEETAKALAVVATSMEALQADMTKGLKAAHDAIRGHGARIDTLEQRSGRTALYWLRNTGLLAVGAGITYLATKLTGGRP